MNTMSWLSPFSTQKTDKRQTNKHNGTWDIYLYLGVHILSISWNYDIIIDFRFFQGSDSNSQLLHAIIVPNEDE